MKEGIHPKYENVAIQCACGARYQTRSTAGRDIQVEICSGCHPFFTGKQKLMDTAGRIDRLKKKYGANMVAANRKKPAPAPKPEPAPENPTNS